MSPWLGTGWGLGSALSWAIANASIQKASRQVGSWSALVWAQILGGTVAVGVALALDGAPTLSALSADGIYIALAGVAAAVAYGGLFKCLGLGQLAVVAPIISAWAIGSVVIMAAQGQIPTLTGAIGVLMCVTGNVLVARSTGDDPNAEEDASAARPRATPRAAIAWAFLAASGFSFMVPLLSRAGKTVGRLWAVPLVWTVELMVLVPILLSMSLLQRPRTAGAVRALGAAAIFEVSGFICISLALGIAPVTVVSPVSSLSTIFSVGIGVLFLKEKVAPSALLGAVIASFGVVVLNL